MHVRGDSMANPGTAGSLPVTLHLRIRARAGERQKLLEFLREAIPFYEAPGGIQVRMLQRMDDPDSFIEVVEYGGVADYERDNRRVDSDPEMKEILDRWRALLEGKAEVVAYRDVTAEVRARSDHGD